MTEHVMAPGGGELVSERAERRVTIRVGHPRLVVSESRYAPGERGPDDHVHHRRADCFHVVEGSLTFRVGRERERVEAGPGTFVLVPPHVLHTFVNDGPDDATFLNFHAPGEHFDDNLRGLVEQWDSHDPPEDGGRPASDAIVRPAGAGERLELGASTVLFKAQTGDGIDSLAVLEMTLAPGFPGPVPHRHREMVDSFHVLEGSLRVRVGDAEHDVAAGGSAWAPPGTVHTFSNPGSEPARVLNVMAPAGLERYLKEVAAATAGAAPDPAVMAEIAARYDFAPA